MINETQETLRNLLPFRREDSSGIFLSRTIRKTSPLTRGLRTGEDIVVPICDIRPADARIVVSENTQQTEAESVEFLLNFFGSREVDSHPTVSRIHQISFSKPERACWHSPRDASQRPDDRMKGRENHPQAGQAPEQRPIQNRVTAY